VVLVAFERLELFVVARAVGGGVVGGVLAGCGWEEEGFDGFATSVPVEGHGVFGMCLPGAEAQMMPILISMKLQVLIGAASCMGAWDWV
jgi:hypothetical protein